MSNRLCTVLQISSPQLMATPFFWLFTSKFCNNVADLYQRIGLLGYTLLRTSFCLQTAMLGPRWRGVWRSVEDKSWQTYFKSQMGEALLDHSSGDRKLVCLEACSEPVRSKAALMSGWHWCPRFQALAHVGWIACLSQLRRLELMILKAFSRNGSLTHLSDGQRWIWLPTLHWATGVAPGFHPLMG